MECQSLLDSRFSAPGLKAAQVDNIAFLVKTLESCYASLYTVVYVVYLALVLQNVDKSNQRINRYPVD